MWLAMLAVLAVSPDQDEGVKAWVHERVAQQKADAIDLGNRLWRERTKKNLPGFQPPTSLAPLVKAVKPGVVHIAALKEGSRRLLGSGFLISPNGLVVTNNHVIDDAEQIEVRLADAQVLTAVMVGSDTATDVALLRVNAEESLPAVSLGDSDLLEVGDWVLAIGNPFGLDLTVTHGIISARERVLGLGAYDEFLQTNAQVNPGNSGGPLFDMRGDVVGVTTAVTSQGQGIGFAVPINLVKDLLPNLLQNGRVKRGWLGASVRDVGEGDARSVMVVEVVAGGPAERSGVKVGDRLLAIQGKPVKRYRQLLRRVALLPPGATVQLVIKRGERSLQLSLALGERALP